MGKVVVPTRRHSWMDYLFKRERFTVMVGTTGSIQVIEREGSSYKQVRCLSPV